MKCVYPQQKTVTEKGIAGEYIHRCGQCKACRVTRRQERTGRLLLETKFSNPRESSFVTLTYSDKNKPRDNSVSKVEAQLFLKRLRKLSGYRHIRYFLVGEYGTKSLRPHYHVAIYHLPLNLQYMPRSNKALAKQIQINRDRFHAIQQFPGLDALMNQAWQYKGHVRIDELDSGLSSYLASYITKNLTDMEALPENLTPEFTLMSRHPGGLGYMAAQYIVDTFRKHKLYPIGYENFKESPDWNPVPWSSIIRVDGKTRPLDPYIRKKVVDLMGGETISPLRRLIRNDIKTMRPIRRSQLINGNAGMFDFRTSEQCQNAAKVARYIRKQRIIRAHNKI